MRISDLSSDVCSSDLFVDLALAVLVLNHQRRLGQSALHPLHRRHDHRRVQAVADLLAIIEPRPAQQAPEEGRHAAVPEIVERRADSFDEAADHAGIQSWSSFAGCADWSNRGRQTAPPMTVAVGQAAWGGK